MMASFNVAAVDYCDSASCAISECHMELAVFYPKLQLLAVYEVGRCQY